jgi:hypothetical protein
MGFDPNGMDRVNQFALVIYIPSPLGRFVDDLRLELAPDCRPHAHVSVLPPRHVSAPWPAVAEGLRHVASKLAPFEVEAGSVASFPVTDVIYLETGRGTRDLHHLHNRLGRGQLEFKEPFPYHPHITVAQEIPEDRVREAYEVAVRRWQEYTGPRTFLAEQLTFVQNTAQDCWVDLAQLDLGRVPVRS